MCLNIPEREKFQTTKYLPDNVAFCFVEHRYNPGHEGLILVTAGGRSYKSVEACGSKLDLPKIYSYLGLKHNLAGVVNSSGGVLSPYTPRELWKERCGKCSNCTKPKCNECVCCRGSSRQGAPEICCYQMVSCELS
jgi:hypothetical protein